MLQLLNSKKEKIASFKNYKDLSIESVLNSGDSTLSFLYPISGKWNDYIIEEAYIRNKYNEYVIKSRKFNNNYLDIVCNLNLEDLEGTPFDRYVSETQTITNALNLALVGTGWTVQENNITKKRTVRKTCCSSYDIIQEIKKIYRVDFVFDTLNKKIIVHESLGSDKGSYAIERLNLTSLNVESDSFKYFTRIIPEGKDGLSIEAVNSGKKYVENYQYTNKIKTYYWKDERYTVAESLKEDAIAKLDDLSKPYRSYSGELVNLAKLNAKYNILEFGLGDTITLISKNKKVREKQRIVKLVEYPDDHTRDSFEVANLTLRFEDQQDRFEETSDIVDNITTDDGTIDGDSIDGITTDKIKDFDVAVGKIANLEAINAKIYNLEATKANIQSLNAVEAKIGTLEATKANITELNAVTATIETLKVNKADITELNAVTIKVGILEGDFANIKDIVSGNISSENIQSGGITGDRLNMNTIFVNDANIININASKINSGEIDTSKVKIKSSDGSIEIVGPTQQFRDKNNKIRIQMGQDTKGDFNFILRGEDGTTTLIDHTGIKEKAIADDLIKENMVAENAVGEKAINYNSFSSGFNKETNTTQIKATKIRLDNQNQSLDVAFTNLKNQSDGTKTQTESNTTNITIQQGQINTAIANTKIIKDGKEILLKDDYNTTVTTVNSMKNTISSHTTKIDQNTGKITTVESKTNSIERDLGTITARVGSVESTTISNTNQINLVDGKINNAINDSKNYTNTEVNKVITSTNSKFSEIKATTDGINQSVEHVIHEVETIDGEVKKKITLEQAKAEIDLKSNNILLQVQKSGGGNLLANSNFAANNSYWSEYSYNWGTDQHKIEVWPDANEWILQGTKALCIQCLPSSEVTGELGVQQLFKVKQNQNYTLTCLVATHRAQGGMHIFDTGNWEWLGNDTIVSAEGFGAGKDIEKWKLLKVTFNSGNRVEVGVRMWMSRSYDRGHLWFCQPMLTEGSLGAPYSPQVISSDQLISYINLDTDSAKIKASKIQLEGCVTVATNGRQVKINKGDYSASLNGQERMFWGYRDFENSYEVPKFYMGAYGFDTANHNYFGMTSYRGNGDNPEGSNYAYQDLSYRCINSNFKDWSNIKMYSSGKIRIAAVENLEITTNYVGGAYQGTEERRLALFATSTVPYFNSNLQIGCTRNMTNEYGYIIADDHVAGAETRVRCHTDSSRQKFFRPCDNVADIGNGSASFPWKNIVGKTAYATDHLISNPAIKIITESSDILDNIHFVQARGLNEAIKMDVSAISGTIYAPVEEETQVIDTTELLKLALLEIKKLKEEILNLNKCS